jgi:hypothetical protein
MPDYRQPQWASLLLSAALIVVGICACVFTVAVRLPARFDLLIAALWCLGGAMIGAGLFMPFRRAGVGALIGVLVQLACIFAIATMY